MPRLPYSLTTVTSLGRNSACTIPWTWNPPYQAMPQQGWQCPVCKNVYAPFMPQCSKCCNQSTVTTTTSSIPEKP
jgi:hypothetical protein